MVGGVVVVVGGNFWMLAPAALGLAACVQTSQVGDSVSPAALAQSAKAVAVMRIGAASPACNDVAVGLGQREGDGFRVVKAMIVANVRSTTEPAVAEAELDPGEYHVVVFGCRSDKGGAAVGEHGAGSRMYRSSYASFTVAAGEIVNVGYLRFEPSHVGRNAFGRRVKAEVAVTDWPLAELDRYKAKRPAVYAQMKTRLMTVTAQGEAEPGEAECRRLAALAAEGKVQKLPAACAAPVPSPASGRKSPA